MKNDTEKKLRSIVKEKFETMRQIGIQHGAIVVAKVILDKANDAVKSPEDRLADIIEFCEVLFVASTKGVGEVYET